MEILIFELGGQRYGIPLVNVREVVRAVEITTLPNAPSVVAGIVNVRGTVVPVYNLRARFALAPKQLHPDDAFIIATTGGRVAALHVDRADWLAELPADGISAPGTTAAPEHIAGVASLPDGMTLIADLNAFLSRAEAESLEQALEASGPSVHTSLGEPAGSA